MLIIVGPGAHCLFSHTKWLNNSPIISPPERSTISNMYSTQTCYAPSNMSYKCVCVFIYYYSSFNLLLFSFLAIAHHLSPYSTKKRVGVGSSLRHLTHEMYMPNAKTRRQAPNATHIPLEYRLRLLPNAKKSTKKERNVHGRRKKLASPNAKDTNMLVSLR